MDISMIAAIDKNNAIGFENKLLQTIREDMEWFKRHTKGKPVIMGRTTYESIGKPLEGRMNIVLTNRKDYLPHPDLIISHSINDALDMVKTQNEVMVIGGASVYEQFYPMANRIYLTQFDKEFEEVDSYFPKIYQDAWMELLNIRGSETVGFDYFFKILQKKPN